MKIETIEVSNFKSFKHIKVSPGDFNVLIGANAAGKSNFLNVLSFFNDIVTSGLRNAVSLQGDMEFLPNINLGDDDVFVSLTTVDDESLRIIKRFDQSSALTLKPHHIRYSLQLGVSNKGQEYYVVDESLRVKYELVAFDYGDEGPTNFREMGHGYFLLVRGPDDEDGQVRIESKLSGEVDLSEEELENRFFSGIELSGEESLLEKAFLGYTFPPFADFLSNITVYNVNPKLAQQAFPIGGKKNLEEDGSNIAILLRNILENEEQSTKLADLVADLLPFVNKVDVEKFADKSLMALVRESYSEGKDFPASLISEGTINIIALVVALYFEEKPLIAFEEPERHLHPSLISKVIQMMKDQANSRQIFLTTHNPELIKHVDLEDLLLVRRSEDGFSTIERPSENEMVRTFLENELGLEDLFIDDMLTL